jgi:hypothetical protein
MGRGGVQFVHFTVIAIDVSSADEKDFHNYGDCLNGFYASFRSMLPWQKEAAKILTSQEIQVCWHEYSSLTSITCKFY